MNDELADRNSAGATVCIVRPSRKVTWISRSANVTLATAPRSTCWRNSENASGSGVRSAFEIQAGGNRAERDDGDNRQDQIPWASEARW